MGMDRVGLGRRARPIEPVPDPDNDPHLTVHMVDDGGLSYTAFFGNLVRFAVGLGLATALVALFLSGTLRGEVGRSGMPLMSLCLVAAVLPSAAFEIAGRHGSKRDLDARLALLLAALLLASCWVLRVSWRLP